MMSSRATAHAGRGDGATALSGARVTVMGLGLFGGGAGVVRWLHAQGARVRISDRRDERTLAPAIRALDALREAGGIEVECGRHSEAWFTDTDLVIANAAVPTPWENPLLRAARAAAVPVSTEIRLSLEALHGVPTIGITGSAGKSTTSAMTTRALDASGRRAILGGNFGGSLLGDPRVVGADWIVLELSSAQLWWLSDEAAAWSGCSTLGWRPTIGALTNLAHNHLDWHGSFEHYARSKSGVIARDGSLLTWAAGLESPVADVGEWTPAPKPEAGPLEWWMVPPPTVDPAGLSLCVPGAHMEQNAMLALAILERAAQLDGRPLSRSACLAALNAFEGLPHRMERVADCGRVHCFNDSKSTTPAATMRALEAFPDRRRVHLIVGGYDKKIDLGAIAALAPSLGGLYAIGQVQEQLTTMGGTGCGTLANAVAVAWERLRDGDTLLLSPACASTDQYANFEQRGEEFVRLVRHAAARTAAARTAADGPA